MSICNNNRDKIIDFVVSDDSRIFESIKPFIETLAEKHLTMSAYGDVIVNGVFENNDDGDGWLRTKLRKSARALMSIACEMGEEAIQLKWEHLKRFCEVNLQQHNKCSVYRKGELKPLDTYTVEDGLEESKLFSNGSNHSNVTGNQPRRDHVVYIFLNSYTELIQLKAVTSVQRVKSNKRRSTILAKESYLCGIEVTRKQFHLNQCEHIQEQLKDIVDEQRWKHRDPLKHFTKIGQTSNGLRK